MSQVGSPIDTSLLQAAQAQKVASKARDSEKAAAERTRRYQDMVDLRVAGVEDAEAVRRLPQNESEEAETEHRRGEGQLPAPPPDGPGQIDIQA